MNRLVCKTSLAVAVIVSCQVQASEETLGPKGINSLVTGLNGMNSAIGQVEPFRPGVHGYDTAANCCNDKVVPFEVYVGVEEAGVNELINDHAIWVASVMISEQTATSSPNRSPPIGVAPETLLVSAAFEASGILQESAALAAQAITHLSYATNMSFGLPDEGVPNGA